MGVRGLSTFVNNQENKYLKNHKLYKCIVLLDGNSVAYNLFTRSYSESAFGGDYDKFAKFVKEFFKVLQKCEISPLVIFDGGYEQRKLRTVYTRMKEKCRRASNVLPCSGSLNYPLFMRIVFREVLSELHIPFAQSDFEADDELAALARQYQCPVISYDSDFFIYDVSYIPLPSINIQPVAFKNGCENSFSSKKYYLECKIYNVEVFLNSFGGLDKSMLPLLAALLGNDYIRRSTFKAFYASLKIPKGKTNPLQRKIKAVIEWLRNESFESAVTKILGRMEKKSRNRVLVQLNKIVNGYIQCSSVLSEYLGISVANRVINVTTKYQKLLEPNAFQTIESLSGNLQYLDNNTDNLQHSPSNSNENSLNENQNDSSESDEILSEVELDKIDHVLTEINEELLCDRLNLPVWLLDYARKGKIQSSVIDIISLKQYFFQPQVEDYSLTPSHDISLRLISAIVGFLLGNTDNLVKCWTRNGLHLDWYIVDPTSQCKSFTFPPCNDIFTMSQAKRQCLLLEVSEICIDVHLFPDEWQLFVVAILFWLKNMKHPIVTESHLHTLAMCLIAVFTIDSKIGIHRNKQSFTKKYKNYLCKLIDSRIKEKKSSEESDKPLKSFSNNEKIEVNPKLALSKVTHDDCVLMFEAILPYHHLNQQIVKKPKIFNLATVHALAQFQSCLFHLLVLNSVLGFPFLESVVSRLYSGTFAYNMFVNISKRKNISAYIGTFFITSPSLLNLYNAVIFALKSSLNIELNGNKVKKVTKKRKKVKKVVEDDVTNEIEKDEHDEPFIDENNIFSRLSLT